MLDVGYIVIDGGNIPCLSQCYCYSLLLSTDTRHRIISYRLNPSQPVIEGQTDCSYLSFGSIFNQKISDLKKMVENMKIQE